jgi:glycosyltransferase involved in cell wall biosynthesis
MKILHCGIGSWVAIARELSKLGDYRFFDWTRYTEIGAFDLMRKSLVDFSQEFNPDLTFIHIQHKGVIDGELAKKLKGFVINWTCDVVEPIPTWYRDVGKEIGMTAFCNEDHVDLFNQEGIPSTFLQVGYDEQLYKPEGSRGEWGDVVYLGNVYPKDRYNFPMSDYREEMVDLMHEKFGKRFKAYGHGWKQSDGILNHRQEKEAECYRSAKIGINLSHFELRRYTSDRLFRIMGSGCFCLSRWHPEIEKDFTDGVHLRVWRTLDELVALTEYYLDPKNEEERLRIAKAGHELVASRDTWTNRAMEIERIYKSHSKSNHTDGENSQSLKGIQEPSGDRSPEDISTSASERS